MFNLREYKNIPIQIGVRVYFHQSQSDASSLQQRPTQVKMNCCYLAVIKQFQTAVICFGSAISRFMQINHLHKGIPMAVNSSSLAFPVL